MSEPAQQGSSPHLAYMAMLGLPTHWPAQQASNVIQLLTWVSMLIEHCYNAYAGHNQRFPDCQALLIVLLFRK